MTVAQPEMRPVVTAADLFREHGAFAWRAIRRFGVAERDADDACQEVFVVVHRRLGDFEWRSSARTWIYGIAARVAADYRKRAHVRREVITDAPPEVVATDDPHEHLSRRQARARLDAILDRLDDDKRAVFVLYEIEQATMQEIALALSCPLQTAYSRLHAARKIVSDAVEAERRNAS